MVLAATWLGGRKDRSQQHIFLITKFFNDFAFIVQCSSKISCTFLALFDTIRYDTIRCSIFTFAQKLTRWPASLKIM